MATRKAKKVAKQIDRARKAQNPGRPKLAGERYPSGKLKPVRHGRMFRDPETGALSERAPRECEVYVIGPEVGAQKIGFANDVDERARQLQTASPRQLYIHFHTPAGTLASRVERRAHEMLADYRLCGEWFYVTPRHAEKTVEEAKRQILASASSRP